MAIVYLPDKANQHTFSYHSVKLHIHTDAIKEHLIPVEIDQNHRSLIYANEADVLNVALFGMTAKEWRDAHPLLKEGIVRLGTLH